MAQERQFKRRKGCATCDKIADGDKKLYDRINLSRAFIPGGESVRAIATDTGLSYESVYNHSKKHQAPSKSKLEQKIRNFEAKEKYNEIVAQGSERAVVQYTGHADARRELLQKGMEAFERGDMKMGMSHMVAMLGQEQKAEENAKDRSLEMMKMFNYFASGSGNSGDGSAADDDGEVVEGEVVG